MLGGEKSSGTKKKPQKTTTIQNKTQKPKKKHTTKEPHDVQTMGI